LNLTTLFKFRFDVDNGRITRFYVSHLGRPPFGYMGKLARHLAVVTMRLLTSIAKEKHDGGGGEIVPLSAVAYGWPDVSRKQPPCPLQ